MRIKTVTLGLALGSVAMFAASAMAQSAPAGPFTPYASIRMFIGGLYENHTAANGSHGDVEFLEHLNATSRLGVDFNKGALGGKAEIGLAANATGGTPYLRHAFLTYKFAMGLEILAGQTDTPMNFPPAQDGWDDSFMTGGAGSSNMGRIPQIKLSFAGAYLDLIAPRRLEIPTVMTGDEYYVSGYPTIWGEYADTYMPRIAVGYEYKSQMISGGIGAAFYQYFAQTNEAKTVVGDNEFAWMVYGHGKVDLGAIFVAFNASFQHAPALLGMVSASLMNNKLVRQAAVANLGDSVFEGYVEVGYKLPSGVLSFLAGYTQNVSDSKNDAIKDAKGNANILGLEILYAHEVVKGFKIIPQVLYTTSFKKDLDNPEAVEFGIKFQGDL